MPELNLDAIANRKPLTIADNGLSPEQVIFLDAKERDALVARVRELEKQVDHCIHDAVDEQERFKALLYAVREDDLGGRATAQAIVNLEVDDD